MTMQFISHRFPEDHDPTIGKSEYHLCFTNKPHKSFFFFFFHKSFFVSVFETVLNHLYFDPLLVPKQTYLISLS